MTSIRALLVEARQALANDDAQREAEILVAHASEQSRAWLFAHGDDEATDVLETKVRSLVAQRAAGVPIAHLIGKREFWSLPLDVNADVLIPRPETELLVELALRQIPQHEKVDIVDLGTGSGAIALAIAHERPISQVVAVDASEAALVVARRNAARLQLKNVEFVGSDWFSALPDRRFHVIVANPPYIASADEHLSRGDLRFEPRMALVSGVDGLESIRRIVVDAAVHLHAGGWLMIEHGFDQGERVRRRFVEVGFDDVITYCDIEERERVTMGVWGGFG